MRFERPALKWKEEHEAYMREWDDERMTPSSFHLPQDQRYEDYLTGLAKREKGDGKWIASTNYFAVDDRDRIVGMIDIRHGLNDHLLQVGGHIGYGVRPSKRRKGLATAMLQEALHVTDALGIAKVLVTCNAENTASAKVIMKNGGVETDSFTESHGQVVRRFWIDRAQYIAQ